MSILLRTEIKKTHHQQRNDDQNRKRWTRLQSLHIFYELHWGLQTCHNKATSSCTVLAPCHCEEVMKVYSDYVLSLCLLYRHQTKTCPEQSVLHFCQRAWSPFIWLSDEIYTFKGSHNLVQGKKYIYIIIILKKQSLEKKSCTTQGSRVPGGREWNLAHVDNLITGKQHLCCIFLFICSSLWDWFIASCIDSHLGYMCVLQRAPVSFQYR